MNRFYIICANLLVTLIVLSAPSNSNAQAACAPNGSYVDCVAYATHDTFVESYRPTKTFCSWSTMYTGVMTGAYTIYTVALLRFEDIWSGSGAPSQGSVSGIGPGSFMRFKFGPSGVDPGTCMTVRVALYLKSWSESNCPTWNTMGSQGAVVLGSNTICDSSNYADIYLTNLSKQDIANLSGSGVIVYVTGGNQSVHLQSRTGSYTPRIMVRLPAEVVHFSALPTSSGVSVQWRASDESNSAGWEVYRSANGNKFVPINKEPIAPYQGDYSFLDKNVKDGTRYEYLLRQLDLSGRTELHGPTWVLVTRSDRDNSRRVDGRDLIDAVASGNSVAANDVVRDFGWHLAGKGRRPDLDPGKVSQNSVKANKDILISEVVVKEKLWPNLRDRSLVRSFVSGSLDGLIKNAMFPIHMKRVRTLDEDIFRSAFSKEFQRLDLQDNLHGAILELIDQRQVRLRYPKLFKRELGWTRPSDRFLVVHMRDIGEKIIVVQRKVQGQWRVTGLYD